MQMHEKIMIRKICLSLILLVTTSVVFAQQPFVVSDVRVKGLQRISAGAIFNFLSVKVG
ncbi:MAG: outer membrane protein insertion porin family, partial [Dinoroseobacter sp.]